MNKINHSYNKPSNDGLMLLCRALNLKNGLMWLRYPYIVAFGQYFSSY